MSGHYTIALLGAAGSGKTTFMTRFIHHTYEKRYISTVGVIEYNFDLPTSAGTVRITVREQGTFGQGIEGLYTDALYGADAAIILFDVTGRASSKEANRYRNCIRDIPHTICANKVDVVRRIPFHLPQHYHEYLEGKLTTMSVKECNNVGTPFTNILRVLLQDPDLEVRMFDVIMSD